MPQSNIGREETRTRKRDRFRRLLGLHPRSPSSIANDTISGTSTSDLESQAAESPQQSDPALHSCKPIPGVATPGPHGDLVAGLAVPVPHIAADEAAGNPALPLSSPENDTSPAVKAEVVSEKSEAGGLWTKALNNLSEKDKITLRSLSGMGKSAPEGNETIETTSKLDIEALLVAVRAKREMCLENQWEFEIRGRAVNLRYQADKIISWLAKFKEIGDIAIQKNPGPTALPWAGIRLLLQMAVAERDQMELLLTGVERLTNTASRCKIYEILYLDGIQSKETEDPIKPAFDHLSAAMISLYTVVLRFLAKAFRAFSKSGIGRAQSATFNPGMFEGLTEQLQVLDAEVVAATANCKEACNQNAQRDMGKLFKILEDLEGPIQRIDLRVEVLLQNVGSRRRTEILQWISAIPYEDNHNTAYTGHTSGTGEWLLRHNTYTKWRTSNTCNILWLYGIPGAGKTKLVSTVVGSLRQGRRNGEALAYFYCDRNQPDRQSHEQIMRSFIRQLSTPGNTGMIPSCINRLYEEKERPGFASSGLTFQECGVLVPELVRMYAKVTLVLDALDECDRSARHLLINEIDKLVSGPTSCVIKVFISSRPDKDIKHRFQDGPNVCISATDNGADIKKFVVDTMNNSPPEWLEEVTSAPGLREEIATTLHEKAEGMFLWAKLQMDQLLRLVFVSDIQDFLGKLPKDLKRTYDGIIDQINSQEGRTPEIARRAFLWVMCSIRPLTPGMLTDAVCRDPETGATYPIDIHISVVLEACRNLVVIDHSGVCRFSHLSVQEYLETWHYSNVQAHLEVGLACLQMLLDPMNWWRIESLVFSFTDAWDDESILRYTVVYWPDHIRLHAEGRISDRVPLVLKSFLGSPNEGSAAYMCWRLAFTDYYRSGASRYDAESLGSLDCLRPEFAVIIFGLDGILL